MGLSLPRERPFDAEWCKMVPKTEAQTYLFLNAKCKRLFNLRLRPAKLAWTTQYRKAHKKDQTTEIARKKKRSVKTNNRSIVGVSLEVIQKKRRRSRTCAPPRATPRFARSRSASARRRMPRRARSDCAPVHARTDWSSLI